MGHAPLTDSVPSAHEVRHRIGYLLRELHLARRLLALAKLADQYRETNEIPVHSNAAGRQGVARG